MQLNHTQMAFIFFIYGLASFSMGLAVALELRHTTANRLYPSLRFLAAFGLTHGAAQWVVMFHLIHTQGAIVEGLPALRILFLALSALSALLLVQFGVRLLALNVEGYRWLRWLPLGLFGAWLASFSLPQLYGIYDAISIARLPSTERCLSCHWSTAPAYVVASKEWLTSADVWSRYLLFMPGSVLAAAGLAAQGPLFRAMKLPAIARDAVWAAGAFLLSALVLGMLVPPAPYPPASALNHATFTDLLIVPPQILWVVAIGLVGFFVLRLLRVFELERRMELQAVVVEERERIAREMHDGLAQAIGYLGLRASVASDALERKDLTQVAQEISNLEAVAEEAYQDVRASILDLRSTAGLEKGLIPCLVEYVHRFSLETSIPTTVQVAGTPIQLLPAAEIQTIRIIQEALANVRKHAKATRAQVQVQGHTHVILVIVEDNGRGFDPAQATDQSGAHFGLQTMRERAESVGAALHIEASLGAGTRVVLEIPLSKGGRQHGADTHPSRR